MAAVALAVVGVVWWLNRDGSDPDPVATANDSPHPPRQSRPPDSAPTKPDENPVNPTPRAEEEAFNSAELDSRTALSRADYKAAWDALSAFMRDYPESGLLERALRQRSSVLTRVRDLRDAEFRKAKEAAAQALKDKRTEEAMAALDRFPSELLVPLSDDDHVAVATQLDTQRRLVEAAEATDLAAVMKRADTLREDWGRARNHPAGVTEQTRLNVAGNLLLERDLLEEFLAGRLKSSRDKIEKRLASLRMLLESVHQDALEPANAWRQFQDQTLGEWALWMSGRLGDCTPLLRKRDFAGAVNVAQAVGKELTQRVGEFKPHDPGVAELARRSRILQDTLGRVVQDLRLPLEAEALCESELRSLAGTSVARDYHVHEQVEAGGERSARILRYSGRVLSAGNGEFRVETDSGRVTLRIDMLTVASFRKVLSGVLRPEDRAAVAAWCAFQGRAEDANTELETLLELAPADPEVTARARALCASTLPAPGVLRTLRYLAAKSGHISRDGFEAMPEAGLLAAQDGVNAGSMESARVYIGLVAQLVDPEMVHLATYERALELANAGENHLRNRTILEPLSADAWVAAAKALQDTDLPQARAYARKALLVDASSVEAWEILR
jgi:tetratricopeptide (TPR) repeat protein